MHEICSFNPHTHEGCDLLNCKIKLKKSGFNPHTHEGCDPMANQGDAGTAVSIHTPTKGVTMECRWF